VSRPTLEVLEDRTLPSGLGVDVVPGDPKDWPMYNHDPQGSRYNSAETRLRPDNVGGLHVLWSDPTVGAVAGTPAVVNGVVYAADSEGWVYAVRSDGHELWRHQVAVAPTPDTVLPFQLGLKVSTSLLVTNRTIIFGDLSGTIHGLDVATGAERWSVKPNDHPAASIFGSATMVGNDVAIGISSVEELAVGLNPAYHLSFRGSLVLLDPADGRVIWQTYTISDADYAAGATGAAIWTTPSYDRASNTIYVGTGNNYGEPETPTSDALMAIDAADGHIKWVNQETLDDTWNFIYPFTDPDNPDNPPDFDFGDSPQVYRLGGRLVVGAGQKSGFYHVVDAATGAELNQFQAAPGGNLGGLFADSAVANGVAYANGSDWPNPFGHPFDPPKGGNLTAIRGDGSGQLWRAETPAPNVAGVAVANGVVYFQSKDGSFYALDAATGATLAQVDLGTSGGSSPFFGQTSGPAVSRGRVYVGTGDTLTSLFIPFLPAGPGAIVALGIDDGPGAGRGQPAAPSAADAAVLVRPDLRAAEGHGELPAPEGASLLAALLPVPGPSWHPPQAAANAARTPAPPSPSAVADDASSSAIGLGAGKTFPASPAPGRPAADAVWLGLFGSAGGLPGIPGVWNPS
jgi:polyvinyl alcohol dehydrogenase (cytochrome)